MEAHVGFQDGFVSRTEAGGVLAPVGRVIDADGVADARFFFQAGPGDDLPPDPFDLLASHAGLDGRQGRVEPFHRHVGDLDQLFRRVLADPGGPGQGAVIPVTAGRQFQVDGRFVPVRLVGPGQVGRGGLLARGHHGDDAGVIPAEAFRARHLGLVDRRHGIAFPDAGADPFQGRGHDLFRDLPGFLHESDLGVGFDQPDPVDQQVGVHDGRPGQPLPQGPVGPGRVVVGVGLHADPLFAPSPLLELIRHEVEGVLHRILDVIVRVADDVVVGQKRGEPGAGAVHAPADPDGLIGVGAHHHHLGDVERPAVVAREVVHVGRVGRDQHVDAGPGHGGPGLSDAFLVFFR